jgi:hypothetical protein
MDYLGSASSGDDFDAVRQVGKGSQLIACLVYDFALRGII